MSMALIATDHGSFTVQLTPEAENLKADALLAGSFIEHVDNAEEQIAAVNAQLFIRDALSAVEKARTEVKAPVLEYSRAIDAAAKKFCTELVAEKNRVDQLVSDFQTLELARARAAENARLLEEQRLERERQAAIEKIRQEEAAKAKALRDQELAAAKAAMAATTAKAQAEAAALQREVARQVELAAAASLERMDEVNAQFCEKSKELSEQAAAVAPARVEGQRVTEDWDITVTDIWTLAKHHSMCVKIEPRLVEIKELLNAGVKVAGVTAKRVVKSTTTRTTPQNLIEV